MTPYLEEVIRPGLVEKLAALPLGRTESGQFRRLREQDVMLAYLPWAGLRVGKDGHGECPFHASNGKRSLWIARNTKPGRSEYRYKCLFPECGRKGDVIQLHRDLLIAARLAPMSWPLTYACGDLLARIEAGQIRLTDGDTILHDSPHLGPAMRHRTEVPEWLRKERFWLARLQQITAAIAGREEVVAGNSITMPLEHLQMSVAEVLTGLYPDLTKSILLKRETHHTYKVLPVREWLANYREWWVAAKGYTVQTYTTGGHAEEFDPERLWAVVESDSLSHEAQWSVLTALAKEHHLSCVCWPGGRSLHGWFQTRGYSPEDVYRLYLRAQELSGGHIDLSTYTRSHLVRLPGGWNYQKDCKQVILLWNL
jgi:hypothetical protein